MQIERCTKCGNTVEGEFSPSATRKLLTAIAKTGGMKAVLAYAGSVIPGFGNVIGSLTGAVIDVVYGNDIKKVIDKIADIFQDKKVYVFNCPNCKNSWSHSVEVFEEDFDETAYEEDCDTGEDIIFQRFTRSRELLEQAEQYSILSNWFRECAYEGMLLADIVYDSINRSVEEIDDEAQKENLYYLQHILSEKIADFIKQIAIKCRGSENTSLTLTKELYERPFSMKVYGAYHIPYQNSVALVGEVMSGTISRDKLIKLGDDIVSIETISMFGKKLDYAAAGDTCLLIIPDTPIDSDKEHEIYFIDEIFDVKEASTSSSSPTASTSYISSEEAEYLAEYEACLKDDGVITDRERRLLDRLRTSLGISEERARELEAFCAHSSFTDEEQEYAEEFRACLAEGGSISGRERRLLDKLRDSLGISETRAIEIEKAIK